MIFTKAFEFFEIKDIAAFLFCEMRNELSMAIVQFRQFLVNIVCTCHNYIISCRQLVIKSQPLHQVVMVAKPEPSHIEQNSPELPRWGQIPASQNQADKDNRVKFALSLTKAPSSDARRSTVAGNLRNCFRNSEELIAAIQQGYGWSTRLKSEKVNRGNKNWDGQQIFGIDIDDGFSLDQALSDPFLRSNALFIYTSKSHQKEKNGVICDRFRVVFAFDRVISNPMAIYLLNAAFIGLYKHDSSCKDLCRLYFGNLNAEIHRFDPQNRLNIAEILIKFKNSMPDFSGSLDGILRTRQVSIEDFMAGIDFLPAEQITKLFDSSTFDEIKLIQREWASMTASESSATSHNRTTGYQRQKVRKVDFAEIRNSCELVQNIKRTNYHELRHIASAYYLMEGGKKEFVRIAKESGREFDVKKRGVHYFQNVLNEMDEMKTFAWLCRNYCKIEYRERCKHYENLGQKATILNIARKGYPYERLPDRKLISLSEAREMLNQTLDEIITADDRKINILQGVTGLGKTTTIKRILNDLKARGIPYLYVTPQHHLLQDIPGDPFVALDAKLSEKAKEYTKFGFSAADILSTTLRGTLTDTEKLKLQVYYDSQTRAKESKFKTATTEKFFRCYPDLIASPETNPRYIFVDEDPVFGGLLKTNTLPIEFLRSICSLMASEKSLGNFFHKLLPRSKGYSTIERLCNDLLLKAPGEFMDFRKKRKKINSELVDFKKLVKNSLRSLARLEKSGNIFDFLEADLVFIGNDNQIHYGKKRTFPKDVTIIVLSATINPKIAQWSIEGYSAEKRDSDRINVYDISNVEPKAELIQVYDRSYAKSSWQDQSQTPAEINELRKKFPDFKVVTHSYADMPSGDLHFGTAIGRNDFDGENLLVIGTKNPSPDLLRMWASLLGMPTKDIATGYQSPMRKRVQNEHFDFRYSILSENTDLQMLQFYLPDSVLRQTIGRARIHSNRNIVVLFSNFPMPGFLQLNQREFWNRYHSGKIGNGAKYTNELASTAEDFHLAS